MNALSLRGMAETLVQRWRSVLAPANGGDLACPAKFNLTEVERTSFVDQGFFIRESVFEEHELVGLRDAVENVHRRIMAARDDSDEIMRIDGHKFQTTLGSVVKWEWRDEDSAIRSMEPVHHLDDALDALIDDERLCAPARGLLGVEEVSLFTDKLNFKRPGGAPFPWHQDAPYWAFGCQHLDRLASMQIYLDDATEQNGCLWMIPGSHRQGHIKAPNLEGDLQRLYTDVSHISDLEPQALVAPAGSIIFFDGYVVHGSKSNRANSDRRALILTYQTAGLPRWNTDQVRIPVAQRVGAAAAACV